MLVIAALAVPVSHRGDDVDDYDRERARMGRASARALVQRICGDHSHEDDAREILVERGLPTLPALFREQVRLEREDGNCAAPASVMAEILATAHEDGARRRAARAAFDLVLRALRSGHRDEAVAALVVVEALAGGSIFDRDDARASTRAHDPPPPAALLDSAVEPVMALVRTGQGAARKQALETMAAIGAPFARFVPELEKLLDDPSARPMVLVALERIGPAAAPAQAGLRARLHAETEAVWVRRYAEVLKKIGPDAKLALPDLWSRLRDERGQDCATRAERVVDMARLILAIDADLHASAPQGGGAALVAALDRGLRVSVACQTTATEVMADMLRRLPGPLTRAAYRGQMTDEDLPLRYRMMAADALNTQGATLPAPEQDLRRILAARRTSADGERSDTMPAVARCRTEGGLSGPPAVAPPGPSARDEDIVEGRARDCLDRHLCGPGRDRYRRALSVCCRYAYGDNQPGWCRDGR